MGEQTLYAYDVPRLIVVCGMESTGTRLVQDILCRQVVCEGDSAMTEKWWEREDIPPPVASERRCIVTRRSLPHGPVGPKRTFYDVAKFIRLASGAGWYVQSIVTTRDIESVVQSKTNNHTHNRDRAVSEYHAAKPLLDDLFTLQECRPFVHSYESLMMLGVAYVQHMLNELGFNIYADRSRLPTLVNGNAKYMGAPLS